MKYFFPTLVAFAALVSCSPMTGIFSGKRDMSKQMMDFVHEVDLAQIGGENSRSKYQELANEGASINQEAVYYMDKINPLAYTRFLEQCDYCMQAVNHPYKDSVSKKLQEMRKKTERMKRVPLQETPVASPSAPPVKQQPAAVVSKPTSVFGWGVEQNNEVRHSSAQTEKEKTQSKSTPVAEEKTAVSNKPDENAGKPTPNAEPKQKHKAETKQKTKTETKQKVKSETKQKPKNNTTKSNNDSNSDKDSLYTKPESIEKTKPKTETGWSTFDDM